MSIWNKVLLGLLCVAGVAYFLFAARTLKTHAVWRQSVVDHEAAIEVQEESNRKLMDGEPDKPGIRQLKQDLAYLAIARPRIWAGCRPRNVTPAGEAMVEGDSLGPQKIAMKTVVYVFDDNEVPQGGRYLGKFTVSQVGEKQAVLQPAYSITPAEVTRLQRSQGMWSLHQNLPMDDNRLLAEWDEAAKKAMLPATTVEEFLTDAKDAQGEWKRKLRDYRVLFDIYYRQRAEMIKQTDAATRDLQYLTAAVAGQEEQKKFFERTVAILQDELKAAEAERAAVLAHNNALAERTAAMNAALDQLAKQNQAALAELARAQWEATQRIEDRARRMAQARGSQ